MAKFPKFVPREHIRGLTEAARQILAEELVRDGKMPSFDQVLAAIDETRNEYRAPILAARPKKSGKPLFGQERFNVPEIVPVLYLAAESGDGALKLRCDKFGITIDKTKFLARTLSQGLMLMLGEGPLLGYSVRDKMDRMALRLIRQETIMPSRKITARRRI